MKQYYTIGEIANMLGIGIDAIRFYEKKGLVHPHKNTETHYRYYSMHNILELLDIIYYRELDLSIADITSIFQTGNKDQMKVLLEEKRLEAQRRMRYEKQLIKKIEYIEEIYEKLDEQNGIKVVTFPKTYVLSKSSEKDEIMKSQLAKLSKDEFVLSSLYSTYHVESLEAQELYITMNASVMKDFPAMKKKKELLALNRCIYTVIQMHDTFLQQDMILPLIKYAKDHELQIEPLLYVHEVPLTSYMDANNYYAELFLPIADKNA